VPRADPAEGLDAPPVPGADVVGERLGRPIAGRAVVAHQPALGVGQDPPPLRVTGQVTGEATCHLAPQVGAGAAAAGVANCQLAGGLGRDRAEADDHPRLLIAPGQRRRGHDDVGAPDLACALLSRSSVNGRDGAPQQQVDERVGPSGIDPPGVVRSVRGVGEPAQALPDRDRVADRKVRLPRDHAVVDLASGPHEALAASVQLAATGQGWVGGDHEGAQRRAGLGCGTQVRARQHGVGDPSGVVG